MSKENAPKEKSPFELILVYCINAFKALVFLSLYFACVQYLSQGTTQNSMAVGLLILVNLFCFITCFVLFGFFGKKAINYIKNRKKTNQVQTPNTPSVNASGRKNN